jgi:hypothetical protein
VNGQVFNFSKIEKGRVYTLNAVIIPDVPDPRPELVGRGNPLVAGAILIRFHDESFTADEAILEKVGLYDHQVFPALSYELMRKRYIVGNLSIPFNIFQVKPSQTFSGRESEAANRVIKADTTVVMLPNKAYPPVIKELSLGKFVGNPFFTRESLYETITLKNMANKQLSRKGQTFWQVQDDPKVIANTSIKLYDMNGIVMTDTYMIGLRDRFVYDFWKRGVQNSNVSLSHPLIGVPPDVLVIPKSSDSRELTAINTFSILINESLNGTRKHFFIDLTDPEVTEVPVWKESVESCIGIHIDRVDMKTLNLIGGMKSQIVLYPTEQASIGFSPAVVRRANEIVYESYTQRLELKTDLFKDIDADSSKKEEEKDTEDTNEGVRPIGLIIGEEWVSTLDKLCKKYRPDIEWKHYVHGTDIHFNELVNVKYVVGTSTGTAWILTMMINPKKASVIEIAKEHEYDPKWYHVSSSIGCKHAVLPLKTEPTKQCIDRIKKQLSVYFDELDKSFPAESKTNEVAEAGAGVGVEVVA